LICLTDEIGLSGLLKSVAVDSGPVVCHCSLLATTIISMPSESTPSWARLDSAGNSLRRARSPVAPNATIVVG